MQNVYKMYMLHMFKTFNFNGYEMLHVIVGMFPRWTLKRQRLYNILFSISGDTNTSFK